MLTTYAVAAGLLATDPSTTEAGTFLPAVGDPIPCRVRFTRPDPIIRVFATGARSRGYRIMLFTGGLTAMPTSNDRVIVRGTRYAMLDLEREVQGFWVTLDANPA